EIMAADDISGTIHDMRHEVIDNFVSDAIPQGSYAEQWDVALLKSSALRDLGLNIPAEDWAREEGVDGQAIAERLKGMIDRKIAEKQAHVPPEVMRQIEKTILLQLLDQIWKEHLLNLEYLRQGIHWRGVGQKDPLNEYRTEAFRMFEGMLDSLREKVTGALCLIELHPADTAPPMPQLKPPAKTILSHGENPFDEAPADTPTPYEAPAFDQNNPETWSKTPRNAPCPCGSGKKYKYCHGKVAWQ
ncbi:MAG: SEC-C domain-containing protein, partial [Alphaproteobacteria bacterium]|nr:SEC-C domain-containing protein [Alphaproteobacteria bacterium]